MSKYVDTVGLKYAALDNYTVSPEQFENLLETKADYCVLDTIENKTESLEVRINSLEAGLLEAIANIENLRSELVAKTENPKQKSDLEIFIDKGKETIESIENWYNDFIKIFEVIT